MTDSSNQDHADIAEYLAGNVKAGEAVLARYAERLYRYLFGLSGSPELAQDLGQEVVVRLLRNEKAALHQWSESPNAPFWSYLRKIAVRLWIDHCKSARSRSEVALDDSWDPPDPRSQTEVERIDLMLGLEAAVKMLNPRECQILKLWAHGLSGKEIGAALGCREGTAWVLIHRLRKKLIAMIDQKGTERTKPM